LHTSLYEQLTRRRSRWKVIGVATVSAAALSSSVFALAVDGWPWGQRSEGPEGAAEAFARAWAEGDPSMGPTLPRTPGEDVYKAVVGASGLEPPKVDVREVSDPGEVDVVADFHVTWPLPGGSDWSYTTSAELRDTDQGWHVVIDPQVIHPQLVPGERLVVERVRPRRGDILGGDGNALVTNRPVVDVGVQPSLTSDVVALTDRLAELLDIDGEALRERIDSANEDAFVQVITLRKEAYDALADELYPLEGTVFARGSLPLAPTREFARAVLGSAGPVTAELLEENPDRYVEGDLAGLSGLQRQFDEQLFGRPGVRVMVQADVGEDRRPLFTIDAQPGDPVIVTIEEGIQLAADAALADIESPSALVAMRISDGHVVAVANGSGTGRMDIALRGQFPPGSAFKVVTTAALLGSGLDPDDVVECPHRATADGRAFSNAEDGVLGRVPFHAAFAASCNTTFVELAQGLADDALHHASRPFGIGAEHDLGVGAYTGQVPISDSLVERAASMIGQGRLLTSPLAMADVAATVARGHHVVPTLLLEPGPSEPDGPSERLEPSVVEELRRLMREVVESGSGQALAGVPGEPVHGKTGTAEYGTEVPPRTHAWFVGYQGDLAVAVLVAETNDAFGGRVAAPIAADFLMRIDR